MEPNFDPKEEQIELNEIKNHLEISKLNSTKITRLTRIKTFLKAHKKENIILGSLILILLTILILFFLYKKGQSDGTKKNDILSNIDLDKLPSIDPFNKYDVVFIKNGEIELKDVDGNESLVVTDTGGKVIDFIQSKDKNKIAFAVKPANFGEIVKIDDIASLNTDEFEDVTGFVYQLDLEKNDLKLLWQVEPFEIERYTTQQVPSYPTGWTPASFPVFYDAQIDRADQFAWSINLEIQDYNTKLISYDDSGEKLFYTNQNDHIYNIATDNDTIIQNNEIEFPHCHAYDGDWSGNTIYKNEGCYEGAPSYAFVSSDGENYSKISWDDGFYSYLGGDGVIGIANDNLIIFENDEPTANDGAKSRVFLKKALTGEIVKEIPLPNDTYFPIYTFNANVVNKEIYLSVYYNSNSNLLGQDRLYKYNIETGIVEEVINEDRSVDYFNQIVEVYEGKALKSIDISNMSDNKDFELIDLETMESTQFLEEENPNIKVQLR